eukprot:CAMPEP_0201983674 /NCGR_PEP_ID=MMETSP0904-20121228/81167_1 /ASSEMBLY_ACC=CAM_ASM_000553 /TAXON_ID=420261 /ORGANISM="Thalassiosira antarctica, Strain CCMP982" /LENGTH=39 /DNA_ID= /DNA_START= /DNA_END= /DNA_ORIENTATION=
MVGIKIDDFGKLSILDGIVIVQSIGGLEFGWGEQYLGGG